MKKIISLILICCMAMPMICASAADMPEAQPTIEEILNSYHQKAFEAQTAEERGGASTWSSRSGKTLEEETVDELTAAGYEAYNVTSENYEELEEALQTDFADMGLDHESSYIIVISGEEPNGQSNSNGRSFGLPEYDMIDPGTGGNYFTYFDGDTTYNMRYVTLTNGDVSNNELYKANRITLSNIQYFDVIGETFVEYTLTYARDAVIKKVVEAASEEILDLIPIVGEVSSIISLLADVGDALLQDPIQPLDPGTWVLSAGTAWTRSYIQIRNEVSHNWHTVQCSAYASLDATMYGEHVYNPETNAPEQLGGLLRREHIYSPYYQDTATRKERAVEAYLNGSKYFDCTGDIEYYFTNPNDPNAAQILVITHHESSAYLLPNVQTD